MDLFADNQIILKPLDKENATELFPLFMADIEELSRWFPFDESYTVENDYAYVDEKTPPYDETFVVFYQNNPCGRIGIYDYNEATGEIYIYYWIATKYRKRHIGARSIREVLDYLMTIGIKSVLFDVKKDNHGSIALIRALENITIVSEDSKTYIYAYTPEQNC
ncbi:MAG: GNAT family N-acetyltransferase [Christensenellaceae bacterium]|nr:GNAT family N-acetyltransferase [Christensenellaceae bacterium]